ncbi:SapC family protein [Mesorhizobium sp. B2-3-2]|nr:SapC family protein [Mesorhizobium sp. B2-3-2]
MRHYPIVFAVDDNASPIALVAIKRELNLFIERDGSWRENTYIPAYVRRDPFIGTEMSASIAHRIASSHRPRTSATRSDCSTRPVVRLRPHNRRWPSARPTSPIQRTRWPLARRRSPRRC